MLSVDYDRMGDIAQDEANFYSHAEDYWKEVSPTVDGMLGGYGSISSIDINGSKAFLHKFLGVRNSLKMLSWFNDERIESKEYMSLCHVLFYCITH